MSKKIQAEIEKTLREVRGNIDHYDEKWEELRIFNASQQGLKQRYWEEGRKEQMRGKKHAVRTATLELMDFKHVCDTKLRIEGEMEAVLRKLHRLRQQIVEWLGNLDLRNKEEQLLDMRKQIELRYKRGKKFYKMGISSSDQKGNTDAVRDAETQVWINEYIVELRRQVEQFEAEIEALDADTAEVNTKSEEVKSGANLVPLNGERIEQLKAFVELHHAHIEKLESILRKLRNQSLEIQNLALEELRDILHAYIHQNSSLTIVCADDVYPELGIESSNTDDDINDHTDDSGRNRSEPIEVRGRPSVALNNPIQMSSNRPRLGTVGILPSAVPNGPSRPSDADLMVSAPEAPGNEKGDVRNASSSAELSAAARVPPGNDYANPRADASPCIANVGRPWKIARRPMNVSGPIGDESRRASTHTQEGLPSGRAVVTNASACLGGWMPASTRPSDTAGDESRVKPHHAVTNHLPLSGGPEERGQSVPLVLRQRGSLPPSDATRLFASASADRLDHTTAIRSILTLSQSTATPNTEHKAEEAEVLANPAGGTSRGTLSISSTRPLDGICGDFVHSPHPSVENVRISSTTNPTTGGTSSQPPPPQQQRALMSGFFPYSSQQTHPSRPYLDRPQNFAGRIGDVENEAAVSEYTSNDTVNMNYVANGVMGQADNHTITSHLQSIYQAQSAQHSGRVPGPIYEQQHPKSSEVDGSMAHSLATSIRTPKSTDSWQTAYLGTPSPVASSFRDTQNAPQRQPSHRLQAVQKAVGSWTAQDNNQLTVEVDDLLHIVQTHDSGWTYGFIVSDCGQKMAGWFPDHIRSYPNHVTRPPANRNGGTNMTNNTMSAFVPQRTLKAQTTGHKPRTFDPTFGAAPSIANPGGDLGVADKRADSANKAPSSNQSNSTEPVTPLTGEQRTGQCRDSNYDERMGIAAIPSTSSNSARQAAVSEIPKPGSHSRRDLVHTLKHKTGFAVGRTPSVGPTSSGPLNLSSTDLANVTPVGSSKAGQPFTIGGVSNAMASDDSQGRHPVGCTPHSTTPHSKGRWPPANYGSYYHSNTDIKAPFFWEGLKRGNVSEVHVLSDQVEVHELRWTWNGELANEEGSSLLHFQAGEEVEILVRNGTGWIFGRIHNDTSRKGWFPEYMLTKPEVLLAEVFSAMDRLRREPAAVPM